MWRLETNPLTRGGTRMGQTHCRKLEHGCGTGCQQGGVRIGAEATSEGISLFFLWMLALFPQRSSCVGVTGWRWQGLRWLRARQGPRCRQEMAPRPRAAAVNCVPFFQQGWSEAVPGLATLHSPGASQGKSRILRSWTWESGDPLGTWKSAV